MNIPAMVSGGYLPISILIVNFLDYRFLLMKFDESLVPLMLCTNCTATGGIDAGHCWKIGHCHLRNLLRVTVPHLLVIWRKTGRQVDC
ncbi:hypothetical protein CEXT_413071 [Caerostris extrusa]|uniref:Uncharacterized protein n=1 Tax=Caerostris extrusa TaxID=172846 RepID=A0AAV4N5W8_CAEEX|nr:hypothetical protein CEXT_413071 [Caerostris extrusa]